MTLNYFYLKKCTWFLWLCDKVLSKNLFDMLNCVWEYIEIYQPYYEIPQLSLHYKTHSLWLFNTLCAASLPWWEIPAPSNGRIGNKVSLKFISHIIFLLWRSASTFGSLHFFSIFSIKMGFQTLWIAYLGSFARILLPCFLFWLTL